MKKSTVKNYLIDLAFYIVGCTVYSIAIPMFIAPAHISPGGFTGIALIFNFLFRIPTGLTVFVLNIPIIIIAFKKFGKHFIIRTAIATIIVSFALQVSEKYIPAFSGDIILCSIFGGVLSGVGLGLVLLRGATTGGVDIIAKIINSNSPHISVGRVILIADAMVVFLSVLCYKNVSGALYSVVTIFITSIVLDKMLYGADRGKLVYIITKNGTQLADKILKELDRGVTKLKAVGAYSKEEKDILMCAVRGHEVSILSSIVKGFDSSSFLIICEAGEIHGYGFNK